MFTCPVPQVHVLSLHVNLGAARRKLGHGGPDAAQAFPRLATQTSRTWGTLSCFVKETQTLECYRSPSTMEICCSAASFMIARFPSALAPTQKGGLCRVIRSRTSFRDGSYKLNVA